MLGPPHFEPAGLLPAAALLPFRELVAGHIGSGGGRFKLLRHLIAQAGLRRPSILNPARM